MCHFLVFGYVSNFLKPFFLEADEKNDVKSPDRLLDKKLILLVKQSLGDQMHWVMPQGARKENESMRQVSSLNLSCMKYVSMHIVTYF